MRLFIVAMVSLCNTLLLQRKPLAAKEVIHVEHYHDGVW